MLEIEIVEMRSNAQPMKEVAELFCEVFSEGPWKEDLTPEQVMISMKEQFNKPNIIVLACLKDRKVVGFTWMYEIFESDLREGTRYSPELKFLFAGQRKVFYLQEVGTKKEVRGQGIGERLTRELLKKGKEKRANVVVLSTNSKAIPAISLFSKIGFQNSGVIRPPRELGRTYWILKLGD